MGTATCHFRSEFCTEKKLLFTYNSQRSNSTIVSVVQWSGVGLVIERSLVRLPAGALSSQLGQLSLPSLWGRLIEYRLGLGGARSLVSGGR